MKPVALNYRITKLHHINRIADLWAKVDTRFVLKVCSLDCPLTSSHPDLRVFHPGLRPFRVKTWWEICTPFGIFCISLQTRRLARVIIESRKHCLASVGCNSCEKQMSSEGVLQLAKEIRHTAIMSWVAQWTFRLILHRYKDQAVYGPQCVRSFQALWGAAEHMAAEFDACHPLS